MAAAVRIPAQDTALVAAISASAARARLARCASVGAAVYELLRTTSRRAAIAGCY
ncbi:hypothetical protein GCM10009817_27560 [Terrabacter lapilli]|uniref:Uncharacterized protein n=1 Tax=Terrabacter lapilli TaxID=436231 RepID=A0ABP5DT13_9MICO